MSEKRHLHKTIEQSYCGLDITHLLATMDPAEMTCSQCKAAYSQVQREIARAEAEQEEIEEALRQNAERLREHQEKELKERRRRE